MAALYPRASDTWLVSYPKSGQTWLRFLLCNLLAYPSRRPVDFKLIEDRMPFLEDGSAEWISTTFRMQPPPRIWKSHMPFSREQHPCNGELQMSKVQCVCPNCAPRFQRVVYLVRDGRDVMYSCWRFRQGLGQMREVTFSQFLEEGRRHYPGPKWNEHVNGWLAQQSRLGSRMIVIRYEDMLRDAAAVLRRVARATGLPHDDARVEWAVAASSRETMARIERKQGATFFLRRYNVTKKFAFVQKGKAGGWKNVYSAEDRRRFAAYAGKTLEALGYERAGSGWAA